MYRPVDPQTLGQFARDYGVYRDIRPASLRQYVVAAKLFERWASGPVKLTDLEERSVSAWLRDYSEKVSPHTVRAKKVAVMAMWRAAAEEELCEPPRRKVRSVRVDRKVVTAWTRDEVGQLLDACRRLPRFHRCGLRRSVWFDLAVRVAWDTALRWGDLVRLRVDAIQPDGRGMIVQSKTRRPVGFCLSESTMAALRASLETCPRELVVPWPTSRESFQEQVRLLVKKSGIRPGTWKWLRRGSSTDVELMTPGAGAARLGHAPGSRIAWDSYLDPVILGHCAIAPRPLPPLPGVDGQKLAP